MKDKDRKKIQVLLVVCNNVMNGSERYTLDLAKNLSSEKFEVSIATPMKGSFSDSISENGITEVVYNNDRKYKYTLKGLYNLYRIIRKNEYDILHANAGIFPCIVAKLAGVKFVVEIKHGIFYTDEQLENMGSLRKLYEISKQYFVDCFIAISANDKAKLVKYFKTKASKIKVIYNGLDAENLHVSEIVPKRFASEDFLIIGNIGRLTFQKAQEVLIEAFALLCKKYQKLILVFIGSGENEQKLKQLVKEKRLEEKIIFSEYKKDIFNYLAGFDIFALSSRYEGVPYVILESMELGIPILTTDVGGINNVLENNKHALLVTKDDPLKFTNALEVLIKNKQFRLRIAENSKQAVKNYNVKKMALETGEFYLQNLTHI